LFWGEPTTSSLGLRSKDANNSYTVRDDRKDTEAAGELKKSLQSLFRIFPLEEEELDVLVRGLMVNSPSLLDISTKAK